MDKLLNLNLIFPNDKYVKYLTEVKTSMVFSGTSIEEEGLYSEKIFGAIGSEVRMSRFGYIDLHTDIIHPLIYNNLISLSSLYKKVLEGKAYVKLVKGEYVETTEEEGSTGYTYFLSTFKQLKLLRNDSPERDEKINLINKHTHTTYNKLLVYPAGLRDFNVDKYGNMKEHEVIEYYVKILSVSKLIKEYKHLGADVDDIFVKIQNSVNTLYDYLFTLINGKSKLINKNFTSRYVDYGTSNVLTSTPIKMRNLDDDIDIGATQLGLYQYIKAIDPLAKYALNKMIAEKCFSLEGTKAKLFNKDFKSVYVDIDNKSRELWTTQRGFDTIFNMAGKNTFLNFVVSIDEHYPLVIGETDTEVNIYSESDDIPEDTEVRGITYGELLFYMLLEDDNHKRFPAAITRHPVSGPNSAFISRIKLNTTNKSKARTVNFVGTDLSKFIANTPLPGNTYMNGFTPSISRLDGLGGDHDGDKGFVRVLFTEESIAELDAFMNSVPYFVNTDLTPTHNFNDDISKFIALTLTKN